MIDNQPSARGSSEYIQRKKHRTTPDSQELAVALQRRRSKVQECYRGLGEERAKRLDELATSTEAIENALVEDLGLEPSHAHEIAFHLTDWLNEASFLVALHLFPERFDKSDIVQGVATLLAHAPNHLAAAAKLFGVPVQDVFGVSALEEYDVGLCDEE